MGVTRHIGEVKELPGFYIELFYNPEKEIIGKSLFEKGTFKRVQKHVLSEDTQKFVDNIQRKDVAILRGELFKTFIESRKKERLALKKVMLDCDDFVYCDLLFNGDTYLTLYNKTFMANTITRFYADKSTREDLFFNEEELGYEDVLAFLRSCSKKGKVTFFFNPKKLNMEEFSSAFHALYKTEEYTYIAQLLEDRDIQSVRVFDKNMKEVKGSDLGLEKAREIIDVAMIERSARLFLSEHESLL